MELFDNINKTVKDDLQAGIHKGSKMSVAAACFSIYAYQELKKQLEGIDELRFRVECRKTSCRQIPVRA